MIYKQYGNTGMRVSAIGMGGMRFDEEAIAQDRLAQCAQVVRYAYDKGINFFDTAPGYCSDKSETILGMGLAGLPRESYILCSKTNFGQIDRPATRDGFFRRLEATLRATNTDYLDIYYLWCMLSSKSYRKQCDALYGWFTEAKRQGLIRHIAFSSHMQGDGLRKVLEEGLFEGMLVGYNAINYRYRQAGILDAHARDMGVAVMNPLAGGLIPDHPELFSGLCKGDAAQLSVPQAALRFVAAHREVSVALCGFTTQAHVDDALRAVEGLEQAPAQTLCETMGAQTLQSDALCTGCNYCAGCPMDIPIPKFMDAYNQKMLGRSADKRLRYHWVIDPAWAEDCVGCGLCEAKCTQHLPIIARLKELVP